jgi:hypothetical protein
VPWLYSTSGCPEAADGCRLGKHHSFNCELKRKLDWMFSFGSPPRSPDQPQGVGSGYGCSALDTLEFVARLVAHQRPAIAGERTNLADIKVIVK